MARGGDDDERDVSGRAVGRRAVLLGIGATAGGGVLAGEAGAHGGGHVHSLRVDGRSHDGVAEYELEVDGAIASETDAKPNGSGSKTTVSGRVGGWYDEYEYVGSVAEFTASAPVDVYVDGVRQDAADLDAPAGTTVVRIDGRGYEGHASYEFTASGGVEALPMGDRVDGRTASGTAWGWYDEYRVTGDITRFSMWGRADVSLDGERVDPRTLGYASDTDVVRVLGSGSSSGTEYEFTVDGTVEALPTGDRVDGRTASGTVWGWYDDYRVGGDITEFSHDGPVEVVVDGSVVNPDQLGGSTPQAGRLRKLGQATLADSQSGAGFAEARVRPDGEYAVVGTKFGGTGTHLLDVSDPANPREVHYLPAERPNLDVKFGRRDGLYYRAIQRNNQFDVVDYGYRHGTPTDPVVLATTGGWLAHNIEPHPTASVVYSVNYDDDPSTPGFDVWDVEDPANPRKLRSVGRSGACHDVTVDPRRGLLHAAYQGNDYDGYVVFDVSDPRRPTEVGEFGYAGRTPYSQTGVDRAGFDSGHHAEADPRRDLVVVGDERSYGVPGGKHVFDVGWADGSPSDPRPLGFVVSPNARRMDIDPDGDGRVEQTERWDWTGHDFDHVPRGDRTLLVSGDWHEGVVLYDVTDPTDPRVLDRYATDDRADEVTANDTLASYGDPPWAWNAEYCPASDVVVACDQFTGVYTFEVVG